MKHSNIPCLFLMFTFLSHILLGQKENSENEAINVESEIRLYSFQEKEYALLKISYENISDDTLYLWTQNWRVNCMNDQYPDIFSNCPYDINAGYLNAVTFFNAENVSAFSSKSFRSNEFNTGDTILNCSFVKKIFPKEFFYTNILFSDSSLIEYFEAEKPDHILLHYSFSSYFKSDADLQDRFFYHDDELFINYMLNPVSVGCQTNNVVSKNGTDHESHHKKFQANFNAKRIALKLSW